MAGLDLEARFESIAVNEAARDRRLQGFMEWILNGRTQLISDKFLDRLDESDLAAGIAEAYHLTPDGALRAFDLCEERVSLGIEYGEA